MDDRIPYRVALGDTADGMEQQFPATTVVVEHHLPGVTTVHLGDLLGPKFPVHFVRLELPSTSAEPFQIELNDQGNQRGAADVEQLELGAGHLRVRFRAGRGPSSGRVSHPKNFDRLDGRAPRTTLRSLVIWFEPGTTDATTLRRLLEGAAGDTPRVVASGRPPARIDAVETPSGSGRARAPRPAWRTLRHPDGRTWAVRTRRDGYDLRIGDGVEAVERRRKAADAAAEAERLIAEQRAAGFVDA